MEQYYQQGDDFFITLGDVPSDAIQFEELNAFETAKTAAQPIPKNPEGLLSWLYSNSDYQSLMNTHGGIVAAFERQIAENRHALALQLWNQLPVPQSLKDSLFDPQGPLVTNGYQDLIDFVNQ